MEHLEKILIELGYTLKSRNSMVIELQHSNPDYIGTPLQKIQIVQPREGPYIRSYATTPENILARLDFSVVRNFSFILDDIILSF